MITTNFPALWCKAAESGDCRKDAIAFFDAASFELGIAPSSAYGICEDGRNDLSSTFIVSSLEQSRELPLDEPGRRG
ncbi:MAG: hypothetical protein EOS18_06300 [Mesorhizobium sp.]|nr:MAG: hypothetical protein EOS18_06300 [Mesorhizobium sp.]